MASRRRTETRDSPVCCITRLLHHRALEILQRSRRERIEHRSPADPEHRLPVASLMPIVTPEFLDICRR